LPVRIDTEVLMESAAEDRIVNRAFEFARRWYPLGEIVLAGRSDSQVTLLVEIDGGITTIRYTDLDAAENL